MITQFVGICKLNKLPEVHNRDLIGNMLYNEQVMRDEKVCNAERFLQLFKHIYDLGLNGNVKGGYRLVAYDEGRVYGKGSGDADSLTLAAGEFVSVSCGVVCVKTYGRHKAQDLFTALGAV